MKIVQKITLCRDLLSCRIRYHQKRQPEQSSGKKKVLVVRLDRLGDYALYAPFAGALRRRYPGTRCHLTLLGNPLWSEIARQQLDFDAVEELDASRFLTESGYRRNRLARIAECRFDVVLQPRFYRELLVEDMITMAAAAPESVAFSATALHIRKRLQRPWNGIYTKLIPAEPYLNAHELIRNRAFCAVLEAAADEVNPWRTPFPPTAPFPTARTYAAVLPGSGKKEKVTWPPEQFARLADLAAARGLGIAVCGTADEWDLAEAVVKSCQGAAVNLAGKQSVTEFSALVANAALVIGNDTGGIHIAAMSGVPSLVVAGLGQPGIFLPYPRTGETLPPGIRPPVMVSGECRYAGCGWECRYRPPERFRCLTGIPVEEAEAGLRRLLAEEPGGAR